MKEGEILKIRAQRFLELAKESYKKEFYDLSAFHIEQSTRLYLKYSLWEILGDFEKIYDIKELLGHYAKASNQKEKIKKFTQKHEETINDLNIAYIESRYLPAQFSKEQIDKMFFFAKELLKILKIN